MIVICENGQCIWNDGNHECTRNNITIENSFDGPTCSDYCDDNEE
jgi:hypothetical protein